MAAHDVVWPLRPNIAPTRPGSIGFGARAPSESTAPAAKCRISGTDPATTSAVIACSRTEPGPEPFPAARPIGWFLRLVAWKVRLPTLGTAKARAVTRPARQPRRRARERGSARCTIRSLESGGKPLSGPQRNTGEQVARFQQAPRDSARLGPPHSSRGERRVLVANACIEAGSSLAKPSSQPTHPHATPRPSSPSSARVDFSK